MDQALAVQETDIQSTPMGLLQLALKNGAAIDVIERLSALQEKALARQAEKEFNNALSECQSEIPRIVPDINNPQAKKKFSSYEALDKVVRPIYLKHGFSLSFSSPECHNPEKVRTECRVSHSGYHTQVYQIDITSDATGPKGGGFLSRPHADLAANTLGMRRLLRMIFNIVDTSEDEMLTNGWLMERLEWIANCKDLPELGRIFNDAFKEAKKNPDRNQAARIMLLLVEARDKKAKEF